MAAHGTLLCIRRDPAQLSLLKKNELLTATKARDGLRLFVLQTADAIVIEYHLGLLDGAVVAAEIKQMRPRVPIVMLADHPELPEDALKSVDVLVANSGVPQFLSEADRLALSHKLDQGRDRTMNDRPSQKTDSEKYACRGARDRKPLCLRKMTRKILPRLKFWEGILEGTFQF
jgi:DNA-binding NtrC family response regulator